MRSSYFTVALALLLGAVPAAGQPANTPDGSGLPAGALNGVVAYPHDFNQGPNTAPDRFNYTRRYTPLVPMTQIPAFDQTAGLPVLVSTTYQDGFGNPLMSIARTNHIADVVTPYDPRPSRTSVSYLPFPAATGSKFLKAPFSAQKNYYAGIFPAEGATAYSKTVHYSDAGLPTTKSFGAGAAFTGQQRGTVTTGNINAGGEVYKLSVSGGTICRNGVYPAGTLSVTETGGQHGQKSLAYSDKSGRLLCKKVYAGSGGNGGWLETYYVYNDLGRLTHIVPPKASIQLAGASCLTDAGKLCFSYTYNSYGEITHKSTPGKSGEEVLIYDRRHRPVLNQTPLLRAQNQFSFSIYDSRSRIVMSGLIDNNYFNYSYEDWQDLIRGSGVSGEEIVGYLKQGFPGGTYPVSLPGCEILAYNYYDRYDQAPAGSVSYDAGFNGDFLSGAQMVMPVPYYFAFGKLVASRIKITGQGTPHNFSQSWITSVYFYDEQGRVIQTQTLNPWNTALWDVSAVQYDFSGHAVLALNRTHHPPATGRGTTTIQVWNSYDPYSGLLAETRQKIDQEPWRSISRQDLTSLGQVWKRTIGSVENQRMTYNIQGRVTAVNQHALNAGGMAGNISFAERLSFESGFSQRRFDGSISGFEWKTAGGHLSAYGYHYDDAGRMTGADFREYSNPGGGAYSWNRTQRDFSVSGISFDENGNLKTMKQYGPDVTMNPALIDDFTYQYDAGNALTAVTDLGTESPLADFDNSQGATSGYSYDANGNLAADELKGLTLSYNYQDLPLAVSNGYTGGQIQNIYDAGGTLLQKRIEEAGSTTVYHYWGPFVYRNDSLLYVLHGEGRARWQADSNRFKYDFLVKDHLGNVRTVVTADEAPMGDEYLATHEVASAHIEGQIFENLDNVRETRPQSIPEDLDCERLTSAEENRRIGAALVLKVMAGDKINLSAYSYHYGKEEDDNYTMPEVMLTSLLGVLSEGSGGFAGGEPGNGTEVTQQLFSEDNYGVFDALKQQQTSTASPRAYINYLVFDEDMNLLEQQSGVVQVSGTANSWEHISLPSDLLMEKSGYIAVYLSNEEQMDVYLDNLSITHQRGRLLEEQHYYPHGLLSGKSVAAGATPENKYQYQGKEMQSELGMELYDFHARQYDPQIGRFWGVDPADQFPSGYTGMGNDPANNIDPSGMYTMIFHNGRVNPNAIQAIETQRYNYWLKCYYNRLFESNFRDPAESELLKVPPPVDDANLWRDLEEIAARTIHRGQREDFLDLVDRFDKRMRQKSEQDGQELTYMGAMVAVTKEGVLLVGKFQIGEYKEAANEKRSALDGLIAYNGDHPEKYMMEGDGGKQQSNGGERSGLDNANIIVGATSFAQGAQENIIALDKSLNNLKYTKGLKVAGRLLYGGQVIVAGVNTVNAWSSSDMNWRTNDGNKWGVTGKAALDLTIGAAAVWGGPVGWVVGGVYFIGDAAGWWGDWGKQE